ncbi:MAG: fatty acid desaturase [Nitrospira sp.]|nr:fatty acid desaturase [Nitrospira sp.]MCY4132476.1 fatty acid desaturase [Nitrospira sp.]
MPHTAGNGPGPSNADATRHIEPSVLTALPHYLPLSVFPLILVAALYGGWWLVPPLAFMSLAWSFDRVLGRDGRSMDPSITSEHRLFWHNLPVWSWAFLWPPTLIFGIWQILVANQFAIWEEVLLAIISWERRIGEFLLASASYPQYATEHVYIHHAMVGTPSDVGSAPKEESFWRYFPKEVASNFVHSWQVAGERLARRGLTRWHYSNPFWRYGMGLAFWYGLVFWMGGIWAVPVFAFLGLSCVFSMKISNYFQHYGLRRVRLPNGRWEKAMPRHSWDADWKFTNWMLFNMQRHADHHAVASRQYPLLQVSNLDESPELPGTYADMMNIVLRPKRWFAKMDPLVDQWRKHFYPEIDDWSVYDSPIPAARPEAFDTIVEIFGVAPRLAKWIKRHPELLDNLQDREFTDLDLPKGFGPDPKSEAIARRGLARLYWTREMDVQAMKDLVAEIPAVNAKETAEIVRNWSNDKAFQIGMHVVRGNLSPAEAKSALSNLAEASISTVLTAVVGDFVDRHGPLRGGVVAAIALSDLASREVYPGAAFEILFVHDGSQAGGYEQLCKRFRESLTSLAEDSLLFSPIPRESNACPALPLSDSAGAYGTVAVNGVPGLTRARCVFEAGDAGIGTRFAEVRREVLSECATNDSLIANLCKPASNGAGTGVSAYVGMRGGLEDIERAARFLQLTKGEAGLEDSAPTAATVLREWEPLAQAAALWRDLQGILRLIGEEEFDAATARPRIKSLVAGACGHEDFDALTATVAETASRAAAEIETLLARA